MPSKHVLVQDAAHGSLLRSTRQQLHAQIAEALETHSPELMDSQPELFARHYAEAGLVEKSVASWGKAGRRSFSRSAMAEAASQLQKGLDQLALLPDTPERRRRELEFCNALGVVLNVVKGFAAPEPGHAYARARELWEQLSSPAEFLQVPYGQSRYHVFRGELDLAQHLDEDLLRLSRRRNDSAGLVLGHLSAGRTLEVCRQVCSVPVVYNWFTEGFDTQDLKEGCRPRTAIRCRTSVHSARRKRRSKRPCACSQTWHCRNLY